MTTPTPPPAATPAPGVPQTPTKAILATTFSFIGTFLFALWGSVHDQTNLDDLHAQGWLIIILGAIVTAIVAGGFTYQIPNRAL